MATREERINDVREMLDYLEATPDLDLPYMSEFNSYPLAESISDVARMMAPFTKDATKGLFILRRKFGSVDLEANFLREQVCERVVTGTKEIAEKITPAYTEDIVEWKCPDSLLNPA